MRKYLSVFILAILFLSYLPKPVHADSDATFSLVNGIYSSNICPYTLDWENFWKNLRLDFYPSASNPDLYEAYGESSAVETNSDGLVSHSITGSVTATYNAQTGILQVNYEITHIGNYFVYTESSSSISGTAISDYYGSSETTIPPGSTTIKVSYNGSYDQAISGTHPSFSPDMNFSSTWGFKIVCEVEGTIPGRSCYPEVMGLEGLLPGDTLSPSATYFDINGDEVEITQERWFINGENTPSMDWNGQTATLELQWTCLDGKGYSSTYTVAAYTGPVITTAPGEDQPVKEQPTAGNQDQSNPGDGLSPIGFAAIWAGAAGLVTGAVFLISHLIKGKPLHGMPLGQNPPPVTPPIPSQVPYHPAASALPSVAVSTTFTPPPLTMQPAVPPQIQPVNPITAGPSEQEMTQLSNIRNEMTQERDRIKEKWRQTRDAVEKLKTLKKKNMIKFLFKQGFEVNQWIMDSPVDLINKVTIDPLMDKVFQKHDTSQDANIIVSINNRILSLQAEMKDLVSQSKHLNIEISKIERKLTKTGKK